MKNTSRTGKFVNSRSDISVTFTDYIYSTAWSRWANVYGWAPKDRADWLDPKAVPLAGDFQLCWDEEMFGGCGLQFVPEPEQEPEPEPERDPWAFD